MKVEHVVYVAVLAVALISCTTVPAVIEQETTEKDYFGTETERVVFEEIRDGITVLSGNATPILRSELEMPVESDLTKTIELDGGVRCVYELSPVKAIIACTERGDLAYYFREDRRGNHHGTELRWHVQGAWRPPANENCSYEWCRIERAAETS